MTQFPNLFMLRREFGHWAFRCWVHTSDKTDIVALWAKHPDGTMVAAVAESAVDALMELRHLLVMREGGKL